MAALAQKALANKALLDNAVNSAFMSKFQCQPANTASSYRKPQREWKASYYSLAH
jgi:hypothetical protein